MQPFPLDHYQVRIILFKQRESLLERLAKLACNYRGYIIALLFVM
jgi:hypothetical protein